MPIIEKLHKSEALSDAEMTQVMTDILQGRYSEDQIFQFLQAFGDRMPTVGELTAAARALRENVLPISAPFGAIDCCGTGGDQTGTYNISTAVALVAASCGVPIAKHGNRASSSKSGAADVLEALGVNLNITTDKLEEALKLFQFGFLMAPNHHKGMKHAVSARKKIGRRTLFNLLGPLANPAGTRKQLIGVFDKDWLVPMAETLRNLGSKSAWIVYGSDGLDEITLTGPTYICKLNEDQSITEHVLTPDDFGLPTIALSDIRGDSAEKNAAALRALLEGQKSAYRNIVLANAAAVLNLHGSAPDLKSGVAKAAQAIDDGLALQTLKDYIAFSRGQS